MARSRDKGVTAHKMVVTHFKESTRGKKDQFLHPQASPTTTLTPISFAPLLLTFTIRETFPDLLLERLPSLFTT